MNMTSCSDGGTYRLGKRIRNKSIINNIMVTANSYFMPGPMLSAS